MQEEPSSTSNQASTPSRDATVATPPKKRKVPNKNIIIAAVVVTLLVVVAVCVYLFWYQNPQKVITDAAMNAVKTEQGTTKGMVSIKNDQADVKIDFNGMRTDKAGKGNATLSLASDEISLEMGIEVVVAENTDIYIKPVDLQKTVDTLVDQFIGLMGSGGSSEERAAMKDMVKQQFDPIVSKIDGEWIVITTEDLKEVNTEASSIKTCMEDAIATLQDDKAAANEIRTAYSNNQFISIDKKLGSKDGALGYEVSIDEAKAEAFEKATKDSKVAKKVTSCAKESGLSSSNTSTDADDSATTGKVELWVNRWSHKIQEVSLEAKDDQVDVTMKARFDYKKPAAITTPDDAMTIDELVRELESLSAMTGGATI